jgi:hypothetical protein
VALTREGRALTDLHRRRQVGNGAEAMAETLAAWRHLDLADLDRSTPSWLAVQLRIMRERHAMSTALAERYLVDFRAAEIGTESGLVLRAPFDETAARATLLGNGPRLTKMLIGRGGDPEAAFARASREVLGRAQKWTLGGGRQTILRSAEANPRTRRWRRVSDGSPCAFCAMLLVRSITRGDQPPDFEAHRKCGCTAEEVFDDIPTTDLEDRWVAAYNDAAKQAKAAGEPIVAPNRNNRRDTVLWRMRRNEPDLFSDGVHAH